MIDPAEVLEVAVHRAADEVARAVEARPWRAPQWVRHEAQGGPLRIAEVAAGETGARHAQLACDPQGNEIQFAVQHLQPEVGDRAADPAAARTPDVRLRERPIGDVDGRLGDPVHVDETRLRCSVPRDPRAQALEVEGLAAEDH